VPCDAAELWLWLLGRATFAGAPEGTGTRAEAGEEEKGLSPQVVDVDFYEAAGRVNS
jgi:hypothetical protein